MHAAETPVSPLAQPAVGLQADFVALANQKEALERTLAELRKSIRTNAAALENVSKDATKSRTAFEQAASIAQMQSESALSEVRAQLRKSELALKKSEELRKLVLNSSDGMLRTLEDADVSARLCIMNEWVLGTRTFFWAMQRLFDMPKCQLPSFYTEIPRQWLH